MAVWAVWGVDILADPGGSPMVLARKPSTSRWTLEYGDGGVYGGACARGSACCPSALARFG